MTVSVPSEAIERRWHVVDAGGKVLGRLASQIAHVLRGKHKPVYSPHVDAGDFVIVINAASVRLTGRKLEGKVYYRHTGYPGSVRETTAAEMLQKHPERVIEKAVRGMLPKNALGRRMLRKLKVYSDADHPHTAQKPEALEIRV
jgi:large subunit ribosomal protein L13